MAMLMADVSSWQPDSDSWFRKLADLGVKAVVVKLTEGTTYQNPKAATQLAAGRRMGMQVHAYHYAHFHNSAEAVAEGRFFGVTARALGVSTQSVMAADVEAPDLTGELTGLTNVFIQTVKALGYPHTDLYTMANWMKTRRFDRVALIPKNLWIASYGVDQPGIDNVGTWQVTNNFHGLGVDMSYDFFRSLHHALDRQSQWRRGARSHDSLSHGFGRRKLVGDCGSIWLEYVQARGSQWQDDLQCDSSGRSAAVELKRRYFDKRLSMRCDALRRRSFLI